MSRVEWTVCERTSRWASAMRIALAADGTPHRLRETRSLSELEAELVDRPTSLTAIEVHRGNLADVLAWLPNARQRFTRPCFVALLDRTLADDMGSVGDVLIEAGAQSIATSPRRLDEILSLARRHAANPRITDENVPLTARVWATLPWQAG